MIDNNSKKVVLDRLLTDYVEACKEKVENSKPQSDTKKHHFIPRFYLEFFANQANSQLSIIDKHSGNVFSAAPSATGFERDYYIVGERSEDDWHVLAEIFWYLIESDTKPIYEKILAGAQLSQKERVVFSLFISSMICRSRSAIRVAKEFAGSMVDERLKAIARDEEEFNKLFGPMPPPPAVLGESYREAILEGKIKAMGNQNFSSPAAPANTIELSPHVLHMKWEVFETVQQVITSDTPAVAFSPNALQNEGGSLQPFSRPDSMVVMPLSIDRVLTGTFGKNNYEITYGELHPRQVKFFNDIIVSAADQFVYLSKVDEVIKRFVLRRKNRKIIQKLEKINVDGSIYKIYGTFIDNYRSNP